MTDRPPLTRERVFAAALEIADAEGVEKLSMRRLGRALGVEAMSLYHHVPDKAAVLDGIVAAVLADVPVPGPTAAGGDWRDRLAGMFRAMRAALLRHPGALPVLATHYSLAAGPPMAGFEAGLRLLTEAGFGLLAAGNALNNLGTYTVGHCLAMAGRQPLGVTDPDAGQRRALAGALDADTYPTVRAWLAELGGDTTDPDALYEQGLTALLAGLRPDGR